MGLTDTQFTALLGAIAVLGAAALTGAFANWNAKRQAKKERAESGFTQSFELSKYIREQVAAEVEIKTKPFRDQISALQIVVGSLSDLRDVFRHFYRGTKELLGENTPYLDDTILQQLDEAEADTKTGRSMDEIRASIRRHDHDENVDDSVDINS